MASNMTTDIENLCTLFNKQTDLTTKITNDQLETKNSSVYYKPDFLLIKYLNNSEDQIEITIVDAKSSLHIRIEHCIQVSLYAIDLTVWIK
ncbi:unnamed protein product [Rotaria sp. Silwood1]|nr:unnamed protein product [Rotaria sp. Silwood1]